MQDSVEYNELDDALRRCGSNWNAATAHGFLCSRLALGGADAAPDYLGRVLEASDPAARDDCARRLQAMLASTFRVLAERQSEFMPLLPADTQPAAVRAEALANWCEGFLHGLVGAKHADPVKAKLAGEPIADVIRDMLQMTRATADAALGESDAESDEEAYAELVEYIRVATQLVYEELAEFRPPADRDSAGNVALH